LFGLVRGTGCLQLGFSQSRPGRRLSALSLVFTCVTMPLLLVAEYSRTECGLLLRVNSKNITQYVKKIYLKSL
jgi:hypothetical protein